MRNIFETLFNIVYPGKCSGCKKKGHTPLCMTCCTYLEKQSLKQVTINSMTVYYIYSYTDRRIKNILWDLKYKNNILLRKVVLRSIAKEIESILAHRNIYGVTIPKNNKDTKKRDFDHAYLLGKELAKNIPSIPILNVLQKKTVLRQVENKTRLSRLENIKGSMFLKKDAKLKGKHVLVIDDVVTTGGTLSEATRVILSAQPQSISYFVLAH